MTLPEIAIKRPVSTLMLLVSLVVLGAVAIGRLPLGFMPDIEEPRLFVRVPYSNATPEQIERMIVRPLEETLGSVKGLKEMWSRCGTDGGMVNLRFEWGHEMDLARVEIREKVDRIRSELPDDIGDITISSNWDARDQDEPILEGRLSSKRDLSESYDLLERKIVKPLERIPGVAQVRLDGVNPKEVRVNLRVKDLELHRIDVREVAAAIRGANFDQSLGTVDEAETRYTVRTVGTFGSLEEIRNLTIREDGLRLVDVADVVYQEPPLEYGRHLDGDFAIGVTISKEAGANAVAICDAVEERVAAMNADPELEGVNFLIWFNQGQEIKKTLRDLAFTGIFGALLASLVLFAFLRRFSMTVVAVSCIPFSLIVACGFIWAQGKTMNTLTLLGLIVGIGMLVDNAVVVMENIFRHQEEGKDRRTASRIGSREVSTAVVAATLTSVIVFLPIIFNKPSEMNLILKELGITVCLTLLASLFISQTLIPLATAHAIRAKPRPKSRFFTGLEERYVRLLRFNLRHRWMTPIIGIAVMVSAAYPFIKIDKNFDASRSEVFIQVHYMISEDLSLDRKEALVDTVEAILLPLREELHAKSIYSFWSEGWVMSRIYMDSDHTNEKAMADAREVLRGHLPEMPGVKLEVRDPGGWWRHRGKGKRIAFQIVGEDSGVIRELADEAKSRLERVPGLVDPWSSSEAGGMEMFVDLDRELAARYGIPLTQPAEVIGLTFRGRRLPRYRTPNGEREMRLTLDERRTESLSQLRNLPLWTEEGERIPLASLAEFNAVPGPEDIERDNRVTNAWVGARYDEGTREQYVPLVRAALESMEFPYGYDWTFGNWEDRRREQSMEFLTNLLLALMLIFAVMAGLFESVRQAIGLMVALPFALAGAAWTLYFTNVDFDQPAAIGLLLLIGVVVNNGIVMLEHINQYRRGGMSREEAMIRGGRERVRPILMTAITTLVGLVPIVVQKPALAGVYYYSMALVIMGGLLLSTFLTSVLLPTTASLSEDLFGWIGRTAIRIPAAVAGRRRAVAD
ncbi:MAG: MMPL family transporter [Candidatus Eisenbacteria bacterium]|nr:MMPL family transporter [Candidatus Latescibacterota bacterium]MBD3300835.1 MMPL family transporter [Candidatus Eisenbacteria bacterium]